MRTISDKICSQNRDTNFMLNIFFENLAVYEIMWKTVTEKNRPQILT